MTSTLHTAPLARTKDAVSIRTVRADLGRAVEGIRPVALPSGAAITAVLAAAAITAVRS
jgi:hypothetical protein